QVSRLGPSRTLSVLLTISRVTILGPAESAVTPGAYNATVRRSIGQLAYCRHGLTGFQGGPASLPADCSRRVAVEARRAVRLRRPAADGADRPQSARPGHAWRQCRARLLRRDVRQTLRRAAALARRRSRTQ